MKKRIVLVVLSLCTLCLPALADMAILPIPKDEAAQSAAAIEAGKRWLAVKGPWELWSYQDKAAFSLEHDGRDPYSGAPGPKIGLPGDTDVPLDQAVSAAKEVIVREFGQTQAHLDALLLDCAFFPNWLTSAGETSRMWVVALRDPKEQEDGMYRLLYQSNILAESGKVDRASQWEGAPEGSGEAPLQSWPPEPTAPPLTVAGNIYYNPRGGKYYHTDENCPSVTQEYLPLTLIDKSRMNGEPFSYLRPCPYCTGGGD